VLPPQTEIARENEVRVARHIAADRYHRHLEFLYEIWMETQETKFMGAIIRLITAQARLGLVSGKIDGLAADAIEGLTFDQCGPLAPRVDHMPQEDKVPAEADESAISSARTDATAGLPGSAPGGDQAPPSAEQVP